MKMTEEERQKMSEEYGCGAGGLTPADISRSRIDHLQNENKQLRQELGRFRADRLTKALEAIEALESARAHILDAYRIWQADDVSAVPPPKSGAGAVIAKIDAVLSSPIAGEGKVAAATGDSANLLPCPFCGGTKLNLHRDQTSRMSWVACVDCGLQAPSETGVTDDDAVAYWNRRRSSPALAAALTWDMNNVAPDEEVRLTIERTAEGLRLQAPAALSVPAAAVVGEPDGWKLVPIEPTPEMLVDIAKACRDFLSEDGPYPRAKAVYRATISSAPKPNGANNDA